LCHHHKTNVVPCCVPCPQIFDFGTAVVYPDPFSMHTAVDTELQESRPDAAPQLAEQRPHNRRGKINDKEAAERYASGYEYRWGCTVLDVLSAAWQAVKLQHSTRGLACNLDSSQSCTRPAWGRLNAGGWRLLKCVLRALNNTDPSRHAHVHSAAETSEMAIHVGVCCCCLSCPPNHFGACCLCFCCCAYYSRNRRLAVTLAFDGCLAPGHPTPLPPAALCPCSTPFCCVRIYHMWWRQRGDVYRVLLALCR
jgi:hypothetical protein